MYRFRGVGLTLECLKSFILGGGRLGEEVILDCGLSPLRGEVYPGRPGMVEIGVSSPVGKPESCFVTELERTEDGGEFGGDEKWPWARMTVSGGVA